MSIQYIKKLTVIAAISVLSVTSCTKELTPTTSITTANVYADFSNYKPVLAKLYAGLALSGQSGPTGTPDISGIDEGTSTYLRQYYCAQELTTDDAVIGWNDGTLQNYHNMTWAADGDYIAAMYNRIYYQISLCNEFLRQTTDAKLASNNITGTNLTIAKQYRAEARFLRALSYWHAMDLYGNVPFVTETDNVSSSFLPAQITRAKLFAYIESELLAISSGTDLVDARANEYGRADKGAAWTLLAKLYLNAGIYTGTTRYTDVITYCSKVIAAGYTLDPSFSHLFLADNNTSPEIIFSVNFDGTSSKTYGGMTFIIHGQVGGNMVATDYGIGGGWYGMRTTKNIVNLFSDITGATDTRAKFFTSGQTLEITDITNFNSGYALTKFKNVTSAGVAGSDATFVDTDFPMFRLADVYLMYAEAVLRGGSGGSLGTALTYVNAVRTRAYKSTSGNIAAADLTLNFILNERGRELQWECHRRTDLIRYGLFTGGTYLWPYKGGVAAGTSVSDYRNLMPIPTTDLTNNSNLTQNPGY